MDDKLITFRDLGSVAFIKINRPEKANAYHRAMLGLFRDHLKRFETDHKYCVLIISGAGQTSFCAGADLNEMRNKGYQDALDLESARCFQTLAKSTKITIAAINGAAMGGGLELALSCDLRICSENASFAFPEVTLGFIPAAGGTQRLAQVVGKAWAKELILGGCKWSAQRALRNGLVSKVVPQNELFKQARKWGETIAQQNHLALRLAKQAIDTDAVGTAGFQIEALSEALLYEIRHKK